MSALQASGRGSHQAGQDLFMHIRLGMEVEDFSGEYIGNVIYLRPGDPADIDGSRVAKLAPDEGFAVGAQRPPCVAPDLISRMLMTGYIKFDSRGRFQWDQHYYALADDVASMDENTVRLGKTVAECPTPIDLFS